MKDKEIIIDGIDVNGCKELQTVVNEEPFCDSSNTLKILCRGNNCIYGCLACEGDLHWYELVEAEEQNELEVIGNIYENKSLLESEG